MFLLALSGGVDSMLVGVLIGKSYWRAIDVVIFVDHGLLRKNERDQVMDSC